MTIQTLEKNGKTGIRAGETVSRCQNEGFELVTDMDGQLLKRMLEKVSFADLITSLTGADERLKSAVLHNLPGQLKQVAEICIEKMEAGHIPGAIIRRSRAVINRALVELSVD